MDANVQIRVARAVEVNASNLKAYAAPRGFPFLLHGSTDRLAILEPPTFFLFEKFYPIHRDQEKIGSHWRFALNSALAVANDLKDWWEFLVLSERSWRAADQHDLTCYRDVMLSTISPHTHRVYEPTTVKRRMMSVLNFYAWAKAKRLCRVQLEREAMSIPAFRRSGRGEPQTAEQRDSRHGVLPRTNNSRWEHVQVLSIKQYRAIADGVGPLPTDARNDEQHCQIRLGVELAINCGLRIDEVVGLTVAQITALVPGDSNPLSLRYLRLSRTKGSKSRRVPIPMWLVLEISHYVRHQRAHALRLRKDAQSSDCAELLLNDDGARHCCGLPVSAQTLRRKFYSAQLRSGHHVSRLSQSTGASSDIQSAAFRFHDLRHTCAVWLYYSERKAGNSEPWKRVQSVLGHEFLSTTMDIYLRAAGDFEAEVSDAMAADLRAGPPA